MKALKRLMYLGYYLKQLDREKFRLFLDHTVKQTGKSKAAVLADVVVSVFKYNISILEYFQFRFFEKNDTEREKWAGTGYMYEYQLLMNPKSARGILDDKTKFYKSYAKFFVHAVADIADLKSRPELVKQLLENPSGKIVFKAADGKCGVGVEILPALDFTASTIVPFMEKNNFDLVEEFIIQHPKLQQLSPSAVNTVRIFTQLNDKNEVEILGSRQRISVNSPVDNMAAGNMAAPIDESTGKVSGVAVYSDITKHDQARHPVTSVDIVGFEIPFWNEILEMVGEAALLHPENRSIGWDIVVTEKGPGFIEGNHDWCKLLWQLPEKRGMKSVLENHRKAYV